MDEIGSPFGTDAGKFPWSTVIYFPCSLGIIFTVVDISHRSTVNDHRWLKFVEEFDKRLRVPNVERSQRDIELRADRVIRTDDSVVARVGFSYYITSQKSTGTSDEYVHICGRRRKDK